MATALEQFFAGFLEGVAESIERSRRERQQREEERRRWAPNILQQVHSRATERYSQLDPEVLRDPQRSTQEWQRIVQEELGRIPQEYLQYVQQLPVYQMVTAPPPAQQTRAVSQIIQADPVLREAFSQLPQEQQQAFLQQYGATAVADPRQVYDLVRVFSQRQVRGTPEQVLSQIPGLQALPEQVTQEFLSFVNQRFQNRQWSPDEIKQVLDVWLNQRRGTVKAELDRILTQLGMKANEYRQRIAQGAVVDPSQARAEVQALVERYQQLRPLATAVGLDVPELVDVPVVARRGVVRVEPARLAAPTAHERPPQQIVHVQPELAVPLPVGSRAEGLQVELPTRLEPPPTLAQYIAGRNPGFARFVQAVLPSLKPEETAYVNSLLQEVAQDPRRAEEAYRNVREFLERKVGQDRAPDMNVHLQAVSSYASNVFRTSPGANVRQVLESPMVQGVMRYLVQAKGVPPEMASAIVLDRILDAQRAVIRERRADQAPDPTTRLSGRVAEETSRIHTALGLALDAWVKITPFNERSGEIAKQMSQQPGRGTGVVRSLMAEGEVKAAERQFNQAWQQYSNALARLSGLAQHDKRINISGLPKAVDLRRSLAEKWQEALNNPELRDFARQALEQSGGDESSAVRSIIENQQFMELIRRATPWMSKAAQEALARDLVYVVRGTSQPSQPTSQPRAAVPAPQQPAGGDVASVARAIRQNVEAEANRSGARYTEVLENVLRQYGSGLSEEQKNSLRRWAQYMDSRRRR
jgi:hypothetical protein